MTNHNYPENGIRFYLPQLGKMITTSRGYQIVVPMASKSQPYACALNGRQSVEPTIFMRKLSENPDLYESDYIRFDAGLGPEIGLVSWSEARYSYIVQTTEHDYPLSAVTTYEVCGNFYENPELNKSFNTTAPDSPTCDNPRLITIYLNAYAGGSWSYTASCAGRAKKEEGCFAGRDEKYTLLWSCVKALSAMKENFEIQLYTENESFNNLLNSGKITEMEKNGWTINGKPVSMAEGYKRLHAEIKKFSKLTALAL